MDPKLKLYNQLN